MTSGKMALNKLGNVTLCHYSKKPFDECHCLECEEDFKLRENTKNGGYQLDRSDNEEAR
jgi:hypothetical protein